ncbi:MAG: thioredoxin family protein [Pseudomonadota bacterium]
MALIQTPVCDFDWPMPAFTLANPNGTQFDSATLMGQKGLVVAFLCNHCPYVKAIAARLGDTAKALSDHQIGFVGIMSNDYRDYPADAPPEMLRFAAQSGWDFPYLVDEDQRVGRAFDAQCTPDFFGFNANGGLQYRGRLDGGRPNGGAPSTPELILAMEHIAKTGRGPMDQTPSMGCSIKWS